MEAELRLTTVHARLAHYVNKPDGEHGCWLWTGGLIGHGYGCVNVGHHKQDYAHRVSYAYHVGPIPIGYDVDHLCHNEETDCAGGETCRHRRCINPAHLEAVPRKENIRRGAISLDRLGVCRRGHDVTLPGALASNGPGRRTCRECRRMTKKKVSQ